MININNNSMLSKEILLLLTTYISEVHGECAKVGDHGRAEQYIPSDVEELLSEFLSTVSPASLLTTQPANQLLGTVQFLGTQVNVILQVLLFLSHGLKLIIKGL